MDTETTCRGGSRTARASAPLTGTGRFVNRPYTASIAILIVFIALPCCGQGEFPGVKVDFEVEATPSLVTFITGNTYGTMTRSSCTDPQLGGFERRRIFMLECVPATAGVLLLDTGNLFNCNCEQERVKSFYMIAALNAMGYDAIGLGPKDFVFGLEQLESLQQKAKFPFLCANVLDVETQQPVFDAFITGGTTEATICITGVVSESYDELITDWTADEAGAQTVLVQDPAVAIERVLASTATIANVVMVLGQMRLSEATALAERVPGIDLIIIHDRGMEQEHVQGSTIITQPGTKGKFLKGIQLYLDANGRLELYNVETFPIVEEIEPSYSMVRLYERFLNGRKLLPLDRLVQPTFYVPRSIYDEPKEVY